MKKDMAAVGSIGKSSTACSRAAANVAAWRIYLPEDCVVAMVKDGGIGQRSHFEVLGVQQISPAQQPPIHSLQIGSGWEVHCRTPS